MHHNQMLFDPIGTEDRSTELKQLLIGKNDNTEIFSKIDQENRKVFE